MTQPALPAPLQLVLNTTGITYEPHSRSEQDGQLTLVGRLIRPEVEPLDVVIYASGDLEAFGVHLWPAGQTDPPGDAAPGVLFEVVETWTFIDPVFFLLSPIQALRLLAPLDSSDALTIPASDHVPPLRFAVTNDLYLKAGELRAHTVCAWGEIREAIGAVGPCRRLLGSANQVRTGQRHDDAGEHGGRGIGDRSRHGGSGLSVDHADSGEDAGGTQ